MYKLYCRTYQQLMKQSMRLFPWKEPRLVVGKDTVLEIPNFIQSEHIKRVLIITDKGIIKAGLMKQLLKKLQEKKIDYFIFDKTVPNPTIKNIEEALTLYNESNCQAVIAFGGGSPIDCAKAVCARIARPNKTIPEMRGLFKILGKIPPLMVVPTTAGTGSEVTLAAVVSNNETKEKYALMDLSLMPHYAVLDPLLTIGLPSHLTATTGMDALTHAIEAFIGRSNTEDTERWSIEATKMIFENLPIVFNEPTNLKAREKMLIASHFAGKAFTRAYVGNVHAIAHTLSGFYNIPHGLANAVLLPIVLDYYKEAVYEPLGQLAVKTMIAHPTESLKQKTEKFIEEIKKLNKTLKIPETIDGIREEDISKMAKRAEKEANPLYPVPMIFSKTDMANIIRKIKS